MQYDVIEADSTIELAGKVNAALARGWKISGPIVTTNQTPEYPKGLRPRTKYLQAVIKEGRQRDERS